MLNQLYELIGEKIIHDQQDCVLIEVLEDGPHLVFQCQGRKSIQLNQHGNAHRRASPTYTIHCLNESGTDLHPVLKALIAEDRRPALLDYLLQH